MGTAMAEPARARRRRPGLISLGVGLAAAGAGAAIGLAAERVAVGRAVRPPEDDTPGYGTVRGEARTVRTDDGVELHVEVDHPPDPAVRSRRGAELPTVVLAHGFALSMDSWHYQRLALRDRHRLLLWDQRGHGRSSAGATGTTSIARLGLDLAAVVDEAAPTGPLVLVGHSMGGMTIMSAVRQRPDLLDRVTGVGLVATSAGDLAGLDLGLSGLGSLVLRVAPAATRLLARSPKLVASGRRLGSDLESVLVRRYSFASPVPASLVRFAAQMIASTRVDVLSEFLPALNLHDEREALRLLADREALVLVGDGDLLTPPAHSEEIVRWLPEAEHVVVREAGHLVPLEHPAVVSQHVVGLVERSLTANKGRGGIRRRVPRTVTPLLRRPRRPDRSDDPGGAA